MSFPENNTRLLPYVSLAPDSSKAIRHYYDQKQGHRFGIGIGKQFIEMHGGTLSAGGNPAGGAIFRIVLPCAQAKEAPLPDQDR